MELVISSILGKLTSDPIYMVIAAGIVLFIFLFVMKVKLFAGQRVKSPLNTVTPESFEAREALGRGLRRGA